MPLSRPEPTHKSTPERQPQPEFDETRQYLQAIGQFELLSAEQEVELAKKMEAGLYAEKLLALTTDEEAYLSDTEQQEFAQLTHEGAAAKEQFINANLRFVVKFARDHARKWGLPLLEVIQFGNMGLIRAVEKFDYTKGFKFSTYAEAWIKQFMTLGALEEVNLVRLPDEAHRQLQRIIKAEEKGANPKDLAKKARVTPGRLAELQGVREKILKPVRLDSSTDTNEKTTLLDIVADRRENAIDLLLEHLTNARKTEALRAALGKLEGSKYDIVVLYYGLGGRDRLTAKEIAKQYNVSHGTIYKYLSEALRELRRELTEQGFS